MRIIGGLHRGRRLAFPDVPGLRPTADRVRETLFNWLQPILPGAACLDLFAGSGALGLEAASRGAGRVEMVDSSAEAVGQIARNIELLGVAEAVVTQADAIKWLAGTPSRFDVVFLDPPFADELLEEGCRLLDHGWLNPDARIYLEMDGRNPLPPLPDGWSVVRRKRAGHICYYLCLC